jgi:hypothetical protein
MPGIQFTATRHSSGRGPHRLAASAVHTPVAKAAAAAKVDLSYVRPSGQDGMHTETDAKFAATQRNRPRYTFKGA